MNEIKNKTYTKRSKVLLAVVVLVMVLSAGVYFLNKPNPRQKTKVQFEQTYEQQLVVRDRLISEFGPPISMNEEKTCGYGSRKFEQGPLGCGVRVSLSYNVANSKEANGLANSIDMFMGEQTNLLARGSNIYFTTPQSSFYPLENETQVQRASAGFTFNDKSLLGPGVDFAYSMIAGEVQEVLKIEITAAAEAKDEFYPMK